MVFTDPPYNVPINGNVSGLRIDQASGVRDGGGRDDPRPNSRLPEDHLRSPCRHTALMVRSTSSAWTGGTASSCCRAARDIYTELKNLCVWNKDNGGMGSLYRSKHELIFVFKNGTRRTSTISNSAVHGRNRTNVWDYAGVNSLHDGRLEELAMHPTVKPVALVADAILDCSQARRDRARLLRRQRHDADRGREDRPARLRDGARPGLRRRHDPALPEANRRNKRSMAEAHRTFADTERERIRREPRPIVPRGQDEGGEIMSNDGDNRLRKPPENSRFKKGQSGNPKGRPKGTKNLKTDLNEELQERSWSAKDARTKISKQRAIVKTLIRQSLEGRRARGHDAGQPDVPRPRLRRQGSGSGRTPGFRRARDPRGS